MDAVVEQREQVVWDHAFDSFSVAIAQTNPEPVQFGAAQEGFALWFKVIREFPDKINRANPYERNLLMLAIRSQKVDGIGLPETSGVQIAAKGLLVGEDNDDLLVSGGWGAVFQGNQSANVRNG